MFRSTAGTWLNYATSLVFQVVFVAHFGVGPAASGFVIAFGIMGSAGGVLVSTVYAVGVPRLLDEGGRIRRSTTYFLAIVAVVAAVISGALYALAEPSAAFLAPRAGTDLETMTSLVRVAAVALALQFLTGTLAAVGLGIGQRFLPQAAPAAPSVVSVMVMLALPDSGVVGAYTGFALGLGLQAVLLAASIWGKAKVGSFIDPIPIAAPALVMLGSFAILSALPPVERVLAAGYRPSDAAYLDYTIRSLSVVQRLIVGGLAFAALGTWSRMVAEHRFSELNRSIARSVTLVIVILIGAAAVAAVSAQPLIALVYQRGHFTSADSSAVASVMLVALTGFVAEGVSLVLTTALSSARHNYLLATIASGHFAARLCLDFVLAPRLGALGIALAYSVVMVIVLFGVGAIVYRVGLFHPVGAETVRALAVVAATLISAGVCLTLGVPGLVAGAIVGLTFALAWAVVRPVPLRALRGRETHPVA